MKLFQKRVNVKKEYFYCNFINDIPGVIIRLHIIQPKEGGWMPQNVPIGYKEKENNFVLLIDNLWSQDYAEFDILNVETRERSVHKVLLSDCINFDSKGRLKAGEGTLKNPTTYHITSEGIGYNGIKTKAKKS